jgi:3-oxoacyl-[acyl-carrier protein] reductase
LADQAVTFVSDFASIEVGQSARCSKVIREEDVGAFAALSGDCNPLHLDADFARGTSFQKPVAHGMLLASYVSALIGTQLPGAGALWSRQSFRWPAPVFAGDRIELTVRVTHKSAGSNTVQIEVNAVNQNGKTVMDGEGTVLLLERRGRGPDRALAERVALVTGGSRGIGAAVVRMLAAAGASVAVNYRNRGDAAAEVCRTVEEQGGRAVAVQADITDPHAVSAAIAQVRQEFGRPVDVLVNNASLPPAPRPFIEMDWNDIQSMVDVQVRGAFHCCQAVIPGMLEQKSGRIVNIGSVLTRSVPPPQWTAFVLAKSALHSLTRSLASEFGPHGIHVNIVSPGVAETESMAAIPERLRKVQAMQAPLRRLASALDIARTVVFLCSEGGECITGVDIPVCGGSTM